MHYSERLSQWIPCDKLDWKNRQRGISINEKEVRIGEAVEGSC
jgi:hypothetical protein